MEGAPLRPLPRRPSEPLEPAAALRHVSRRLPELDEPAARALALVELAGRSRELVATELQLSPPQVADALARGRKALRRALYPLPGSGWCERAERMLSDRIDGALAPPGPARLEVHLRNCPRCVQHERRLVQALDRLVEEAGAPERPSAEEPAPPPELHVVPEEEDTAEQVKARRLGELVDHLGPAEPARAAPRPAAPERGAGYLIVAGWRLLLALAVLLAVASVVITLLGVTHAV